MKINIIGDIAGRFDELQLLLKKMPEADLVLSVGDLNDRGAKTKEVIQWFMEQHALGKAEAVYGNHEDMLVNFATASFEGREQGWNQQYMFLRNGGKETLDSYGRDEDYPHDYLIPKEHIDWLQARPLWFATDNLIVSHAPISGKLEHIPSQYDRNHFFIWNRYRPYIRRDKFLVHGHNGEFQEYKDSQGLFGLCIDNSHYGELCGLHWPTGEVFRQDYLEKQGSVSQLEEESDSKPE